jgi:hypothetical protein
MLKTGAEKMSDDQVARCVAVLLGEDEENMSRELALQMNAQQFATRLLGLV